MKLQTNRKFATRKGIMSHEVNLVPVFCQMFDLKGRLQTSKHTNDNLMFF